MSYAIPIQSSTANALSQFYASFTSCSAGKVILRLIGNLTVYAVHMDDLVEVNEVLEACFDDLIMKYGSLDRPSSLRTADGSKHFLYEPLDDTEIRDVVHVFIEQLYKELRDNLIIMELNIGFHNTPMVEDIFETEWTRDYRGLVLCESR